jgi:hypothetical protein
VIAQVARPAVEFRRAPSVAPPAVKLRGAILDLRKRLRNLALAPAAVRKICSFSAEISLGAASRTRWHPPCTWGGPCRLSTRIT